MKKNLIKFDVNGTKMLARITYTNGKQPSEEVIESIQHEFNNSPIQAKWYRERSKKLELELIQSKKTYWKVYQEKADLEALNKTYLEELKARKIQSGVFVILFLLSLIAMCIMA